MEVERSENTTSTKFPSYQEAVTLFDLLHQGELYSQSLPGQKQSSLQMDHTEGTSLLVLCDKAGKSSEKTFQLQPTLHQNSNIDSTHVLALLLGLGNDFNANNTRNLCYLCGDSFKHAFGKSSARIIISCWPM